MTARFPIPNDALDDRLGIVGTAGSGKTYTSMLMEERVLDRKGRVIHIDPLGVSWGLRLMADGRKKSPYNIVIFGGPHGDLPLTEHAGALIGETVASMAESCIIDLSQLGTKAAERRFMLAFTTALYKNASGEPVHLVFDEVDMFAPQKLLDKDGDAARLLGMMETIVRRGRRLGFIPWLISQRPAVINKDILSQVDGLIAMKLTASQDRKALGAWIEGQADVEEGKKILADLPTKQKGEGVVWIPGRSILTTVQFPEKLTFDSSRTPKRGERVRKTAKLERLDITELQDKLKAVEVEVKANDPKALRSQVADLTNQIAKLTYKSTTGAGTAKPDKDVIAAAEVRGQKAAVAAAEKTIKSLRIALEAAMKFIVEINAKDFFKAGGDAVDKKAVEKAITGATETITKMIGQHLSSRDKQIETLRAEAGRIINRLKSVIDQDVTIKVDVHHNKPFTIAASGAQLRTPAQASVLRVTESGDSTITNPMRTVLKSLAWWSAMGHQAPTRAQVAAIAGWTPSGSNLRNRLAELTSAGLIVYPQSGTIALTEAGVASAPPAETSTTLIDSIRNACSGPMRNVFDAMLTLHGEGAEEVTRETLAERVGWQADGSNLRNRLAELSAIEAVEYPGRKMIRLQGWILEGTRLAA